MRFALIGYPVAGSLSPRLFAAAYGGRYPYDLLESEDFDQLWQAFLESYDGINVTAPFKREAFSRVTQLSDSARESGAVNLVVKTPSGLLGHNSDVDGVLGAIGQRQFADTLVVGTGGAARAALTAAGKLGCRLYVTGRSAFKVQELSERFGAEGLSFDQAAGLRPGLVIYTLPGLVSVPEGLNFAASTVLEAEYRHPSLAGIPCKEYLSGHQWLMWQAAAGYQTLTGEKPDIQNLINALALCH